MPTTFLNAQIALARLGSGSRGSGGGLWETPYLGAQNYGPLGPVFGRAPLSSHGKGELNLEHPPPPPDGRNMLANQLRTSWYPPGARWFVGGRVGGLSTSLHVRFVHLMR